MAAVSAWAKPGAWALDAEEHEAAMEKEQNELGYSSSGSTNAASADFPSLAAAATTKTKKKKPQTLSLSEFTTGHAVTHGAARFRPSAAEETLVLPTGPRERTAEELERSSRGFGYSSYGSGRGGRGDGESGSRWGGAGATRVSDEQQPRRGGFDRERESGPSRADEVDDWGATKRSAPPPSERRGGGGGGGGGLFDSHSRADESDSWISKKPVAAPPPSNGRRVNGGFDAPMERRGGFEMFNREGSDSDSWGKKREELGNGGSGVGGRPRLVLQPRSLPLAANENNGEQNQGEQQGPPVARSKGSNPFGEARPREEVLAEKGQDWKKIDEKLESMRIQDAPPEGQALARKGFGVGNGAGQDRTERAWRKTDADVGSPQPREEKVEESLPDN